MCWNRREEQRSVNGHLVRRTRSPGRARASATRRRLSLGNGGRTVDVSVPVAGQTGLSSRLTGAAAAGRRVSHYVLGLTPRTGSRTTCWVSHHVLPPPCEPTDRQRANGRSPKAAPSAAGCRVGTDRESRSVRVQALALKVGAGRSSPPWSVHLRNRANAITRFPVDGPATAQLRECFPARGPATALGYGDLAMVRFG